uniref:CX domain-containing protein n=1 Tax=Caenorhabditis tropicalis TaxID=1561998 RepID=A0A1I7UKG2_9PELO
MQKEVLEEVVDPVELGAVAHLVPVLGALDLHFLLPPLLIQDLVLERAVTEDDQELRNVTFSNGTKPTTLSFGCKSSESCCGLECCSNSSTLITIVLLIVGIVLLIMGCSWCNKKGYCQNESVVNTGVPVIATTTTTQTFTTHSGPPPPPGFNGF